MKKAILSVYDKTGIVEFAEGLVDLWWMLYSTGGTMRTLEAAGVKVMSVSDLTQFPEVLDGRVKTLHPHIYAGILAKRNKPEHMDELSRHGLETIDMIVCNLYPFEDTINKEWVTIEDAQEQIDIGGVTLIRAASKNFQDVIMISDPIMYTDILDELRQWDVSLETRKKLAVQWFQHTAHYDSVIGSYLAGDEHGFGVYLRQLQPLRYGENSHQYAAAYKEDGVEGSLADMQVLHGKALSFNNMVDIAGAVYSVSALERHACSVVKHNNPCGLAEGDDQSQILQHAREGDPISAFGSIVAFNQPVEKATLDYLYLDDKTQRKFVEVVIAPDFSEDALTYLQSRKNLRVIKYDPKLYQPTKDVKHFHGLRLVQDPDNQLHDGLEIMGKHSVDLDEFTWLVEFWLKAVRVIKSNTIVLVRQLDDGSYQLLGMGAGQPNRLVATKLALMKAKENLRNEYDGDDVDSYITEQLGKVVMVSDAFFPFPDNVELAAEEGIKIIVQPGGSIKDSDVVTAADELGVCLIKGGLRHFYH